MMCHMTHTITGGVATYAFKTLCGNRLEHLTMNYLGVRRANVVQLIAYVGCFLFVTAWLDSKPRLDINDMVNARTFNGEVMTNIGLKYFP